MTVKGSKAHADYLLLTKQATPYTEALDSLYNTWSRYGKEVNSEGQQAVERQIDSIKRTLQENVYRVFAETHPKSPVAFYAITQYAGSVLDGDKVAPLFDRLPAETKAWPSAIAFKEALAIAKRTGVGRPAMEFTQTDTSGNPVALSQFRGRFVLVDFWASWCGPCRNENPNVVKAFQQYNDKGFTVLGVSLDRPNGKERWLKAIHDDGLTWTHVSDLQFWDNAVARQYGVNLIPQNFLIDPHGIIIARNLRGNALQQKLATLFAEKPTF
jgi:peroxiredoxin